MGKTRAAQRRDAAEDVCWAILLMMEFGALDKVEGKWREMLGDSMQKWSDLVDWNDDPFHSGDKAQKEE